MKEHLPEIESLSFVGKASIWDRYIIITRLMAHVKSFTKWRIVSAGSHESAKVSSVVKFSLYQSLESCQTGEFGDYVYSGKLFQTAGAACEKAWSAKARLVQLSCSSID